MGAVGVAAFPKLHAPVPFWSVVCAAEGWTGNGRSARLKPDHLKEICAFRRRGREWCAMQWLTELRINGLEHTLGGLDLLARKRGREQSLPAHLLTGIEGEDEAYFHLRRKNYVVVARRWSGGNLPGDIDLIAWQGQLLCFIEVKTRTARDQSPAEIAVDSHKRHVLRRLARQYVRQLPQPTEPEVRFDVVSVYLVPGEAKEFLHFENAFGWNERRLDRE
jgi:putative endonuclease